MNKKIKYQSIQVNLKQGFNGRFDHKVLLDHTFPKVTGIAFVEPMSNNESYAIGIGDSSEEYHSLSHKNLWIIGSNVPPNDRYKNLTIDLLADRPLYIKIDAESPLGQDVDFEVYFKTERDA